MTEQSPPGALDRLARSGWLEPLQSAVITTAAAGLLLLGHTWRTPVGAPYSMPWWLVAVLSLVFSLYLLRIQFRHDSMEFNLGEVVLLVGLFFAPPAALLAGRVAGDIAARAVHQRKRWRSWTFVSDLAFAGAATLLEVAAALVIAGAMRPPGEPIGPIGLLAALVATVGSGVVRNIAIVLALRTEGVAIDRRTVEHLLIGLGINICATSVALALVVVLWLDARASWVLAVPAGLVLLTYHLATKDRARQDTVSFLYEATKALSRAGDAAGIAVHVLSSAREIVRADTASLLLHPPEPGGPGLRTRIGPGDLREVMEPVDLDPARSLDGRLAAIGEATLLRHPITDPGLAELEAHEAMVVPLAGRDGTAGVLVVTNRVGGGITSFHADELQLLQTLGYHTGIALENLRLVSSLRDQALHDDLTGLANRTLLLERTQQAIARSRRTGRPCAILLLDLDGFKTVNDSLGHAAGDELLITVSRRIGAVLRASDTAGRLGGDEFAMLLDDLDEPDAALVTAHRLLAALSVPVTMEGREIVPAGSVGAAVWTGQGDPEELLRDADAAMYAAKRSGKGTVVQFRADMHQAAVDRLELETALRQAVRNDEIDVEYQPVVALQTGRIVAVEALVRWRRDGYEELLPPAAFVTVAEESGLIVPIGEVVLDEACRQLSAWRAELGPNAPVMISVNLSIAQVRTDDLIDRVRTALAEHGLKPSQLELELDERILLTEDPAVQRRLAGLRALGVRLAIDDFGSGYASLSALRRLQVDTVKIDRASVAALTDPAQDPALTSAMVRLAQSLDLQIVAEGIETAEQLRLLLRLRCPLGQGVHLAPPLGPAAISRLLAAGPLQPGPATAAVGD
jgi:diguanylate cyclase (GGDEF)-like protein